MKLTIEIELENAAMETTDDIALTLEQIADQICKLNLFTETFDGTEDAPIRDANGNTVGEWKIRN